MNKDSIQDWSRRSQRMFFSEYFTFNRGILRKQTR